MLKKIMRATVLWALALMLVCASLPAWAEGETGNETPQGAVSEPSKTDGQSNTAPADTKQEGPQQEPPKQEGPQQEGPKQEGPQQEGPKQEGPQQEGPKQEGPQQEGPQQEGPQQEGPKQEGPQQEGPQADNKKEEPGQDAADQKNQPDQKNQADAPAAKGAGPASSAPVTTMPGPHGGVAMVVRTYNGGRLNLRSQPTAASASLGTFASGTPVTVYSIQNGWALVRVYGLTGYMSTYYLVSAGQPQPQPQPHPQPQPQPPSLDGAIRYWIHTGNAGRLHLRQYASTGAPSLGLYPNGTMVMGVDLNNGWVYVSVNGALGYMMRRFLTANGSSQPVIPPVPSPSLDGAVNRVVFTGNTGKLHLRESPSTAARSLGLFPNGTPVEAKDLGNGWSYVRVNGYMLGYMMSRFLISPEAYHNPDIQPVQPDPVIPTANQARVYQRNGSYVNLRSSKASTNKSNVIGRVPHNAVVDVLEWGGVYTRVSYNGQTGYIITSYLRAIQ